DGDGRALRTEPDGSQAVAPPACATREGVERGRRRIDDRPLAPAHHDWKIIERGWCTLHSAPHANRADVDARGREPQRAPAPDRIGEAGVVRLPLRLYDPEFVAGPPGTAIAESLLHDRHVRARTRTIRLARGLPEWQPLAGVVVAHA